MVLSEYQQLVEHGPFCLGQWLCGCQKALMDRWAGSCSRCCLWQVHRSHPPPLRWVPPALLLLNPAHTEVTNFTWVTVISSNTKDFLSCKIIALLTSSLFTASRIPAALLMSGLARISTGLRKNRKAQAREAFFRLSCSFSPGTSRAVFNNSSVRRFLGLGKSVTGQILMLKMSICLIWVSAPKWFPFKVVYIYMYICQRPSL